MISDTDTRVCPTLDELTTGFPLATQPFVAVYVDQTLILIVLSSTNQREPPSDQNTMDFILSLLKAS